MSEVWTSLQLHLTEPNRLQRKVRLWVPVAFGIKQKIGNTSVLCMLF